MDANHVNAETVAKIAEAIARCDFRVSISRYITSKNCPWVITVGESNWRRNLVVESPPPDGTEAVLAILPAEQNDAVIPHIYTGKVERRVQFMALVHGGYVDVKKVLCAEPVSA